VLNLRPAHYGAESPTSLVKLRFGVSDRAPEQLSNLFVLVTINVMQNKKTISWREQCMGLRAARLS
jgi:hypothetical protein